MTNKEAQFILSAYRPGGGDASEPMFGDALRQAQQDPMLAAWLAREQKHGSVVAAKLRELAPPPGLREAILAGVRVSGGTRRGWWSRPAGMGMAASIALILAAGAFWSLRTFSGETRLESLVANDTLHGRHGSHGAASNALVAMLRQPSTHIGGALPVDFATLRLSGCRSVRFAGRDILEVCFERNGAELHLYVLRQVDFPRLDLPAVTEFTERDGVAMASWADTTYRYVLAGKAGAATLRGLL